MANLDQGFELIDAFLNQDQLSLLNKELQSFSLPEKAGGIRNAEKKFESVNLLATSDHLIENARRYLPGTPNLVRAILFNKTVENNWLVSWHQDRTVAVSKQFEESSWGPWSIKDAIHHVQPPSSVLNQMVTFRINLDVVNQENGCLKVLPNSHKLGVLNQEEIHEYVDGNQSVVCEGEQGSALVMRPHILHSSSKATRPTQRRVLHLEYSSYELPKGVTWA